MAADANDEALGPVRGEPLQLLPVPRDQFTPAILLVGALIALLIGSVWLLSFSNPRGLGLLLVSALLLFGTWKLCFPVANARVELHESGFRYVAPETTWSVATADIEAVSLSVFGMMGVGPFKRARLCLQLRLKNGATLALETLGTGVFVVDGPFVDWARSLAAQH